MEKVLYKFTVAENIGENSVRLFGKPNEHIFKMTDSGFYDLDCADDYRCYESLDGLNSHMRMDYMISAQTKFKLVETPKIDLCKIIGVEELQEFVIDKITCRIENNKMFEHSCGIWTLSEMRFNRIISVINNNEIKILPKYELNEHVKWVLEQCLEDGYEWIGAGSVACIFKAKPKCDNGGIVSVDMNWENLSISQKSAFNAPSRTSATPDLSDITVGTPN